MNAPSGVATHPLLKFFNVGSDLEKSYFHLASIIARMPNGSETTVALRKLIESQDAALRSLK